MRRGLRFAYLALALGIALAASAGQAIPTDDDPIFAARAVRIAGKLRCLVCQNESIADSRAALANDLRGQIREQIADGRSDEQIVDYMVRRYGDFVLYEPPFKATTVLLWTGPLLVLVAGILALARNLGRAAPSVALSPEDRELAARLLAQADEKRR